MKLDGIIEDLPSKNTPLCKATFEKMCNAILNTAFPIGKTEIFYDNDDHSKYLGFTWQRDAEGQAIVGISQDDEEFNEIGKTLGEKKHTMTTAEMPQHNHQTSGGEPALYPGWGNESGWGLQSYYCDGNAGHWNTHYAGESQPFNIIQPSKVFAIWRRIA